VRVFRRVLVVAVVASALAVPAGSATGTSGGSAPVASAAGDSAATHSRCKKYRRDPQKYERCVKRGKRKHRAGPGPRRP
jgi:hypothetical protein